MFLLVITVSNLCMCSWGAQARYVDYLCTQLGAITAGKGSAHAWWASYAPVSNTHASSCLCKQTHFPLLYSTLIRNASAAFRCTASLVLTSTSVRASSEHLHL